MALVEIVPQTKTQFSASLSVDTLFSCHEGLLGLATDDPSDPADYFWLAPGESIQLPAGIGVHYIAGIERTVMHTMPVSV